MKAIELNTKTDNAGNLNIKYKLAKANDKVRVIILVNEESDEVNEETLWVKAASKNPSFDFLKEPEEDIYGLHDGEPFND